jgi:hypothetical protein
MAEPSETVPLSVTMAAVQAAKDKGAAAWKAGDMAGAIDGFSRAIDADGGANISGQLPALLSNRSAARLRAGEIDAALADVRRGRAPRPSPAAAQTIRSSSRRSLE